MTMKLLLLPGDGIGPEVMAEVRRVIATMRLDLEVSEALFGGASIDAHGVPITDEAVAKALASNAVLMGAVGGPTWAGVERSKRPEMGLLRLRKEMQVFANLRPALCFEALAEASPLKKEIVAGLDIMIVRELTGGVYFGEPRGIEKLPSGERRGVDTQVYTTSEIHRVARVAFELARGRRKLVHSAEKSNVMESGLLWREEVTALHKAEFSDVKLEHILADNAAMQLIKDPKQFDVILTDNLFGDILSDEAAMLTGSIGLLPSAALGAPGKAGLYEPVHGSAPDIAGMGIANPLAALLSLVMALRLSLGMTEAADKLAHAIAMTLERGYRTRDLGGSVSTAAMGDAVLMALG
ncbi:MAG: 3-isopropylmalate dehydrogenase [Hyphomonadaceae bacterium]|nr:3-isopropylmalate dehydrogenase [Hyphomonadaceae bacterium]